MNAACSVSVGDASCDADILDVTCSVLDIDASGHDDGLPSALPSMSSVGSSLLPPGSSACLDPAVAPVAHLAGPRNTDVVDDATCSILDVDASDRNDVHIALPFRLGAHPRPKGE